MIRRLFRTGNSVVLSLPKKVLNSLGLKDGDSVNLELDHKRHRVIITSVERTTEVAKVNEEFARQVDDFIQQYRPALEELANSASSQSQGS